MSLTVTGIRNADGQLIGYMAVATDVTEMRRALDSLQSQREVYRLLLDHLPGTTAGVVDENLRCVTIGGHWVTSAGLDVNTMIGRPIAEFFTDADRDAGMAIYEAGREGRSVGRLRLANGKHYEIEVVPLTGPEGQAWMFSVARDVTQHGRPDERTGGDGRRAGRQRGEFPRGVRGRADRHRPHHRVARTRGALPARQPGVRRDART